MIFRQRVQDGGEYPRMVSIETTSRCNAACPFCPYNFKARDKFHMDQDLFEKIVEDCRAFPLEEIEPFLNGEPFVDPRIIGRLQHIRSRLPKTRLGLYSNGYGLVPKRIDELASIGGVDRLTISLNTLDPVRYKNIMGFKLERTLDNMKYLVDPVRRSKVAPKIQFRMVRMEDSTLEEQDLFVDYCESMGVEPFIVGQFNYKGDIPSAFPVPSYGCEHITRLDILSDGKVTLCCQDHEGEYTWGNVREQSVLEVYRGNTATKYREYHRTGRRKEIEPCGDCNLFWPNLEGMGVAETVKTACAAAWYFAKHRPNGRRPPSRDPDPALSGGPAAEPVPET